MKHQLVLITLVAIAAVMLGIPLLATIIGQARGAALITINGAPVLVMTADEFNAAMERARADGAAAERKAECALL
jgi:hypothetical protein